MKKLFVSILALAAFAACQSDFNNDVNLGAPQGGSVVSQGEHTIYAEVGIGEATKATYGDNLAATWEENDQIALLQEHADYNKPFGVVNKLTIKSGWGTNSAAFNGDISVDATSPRVYHIAYPTSAVSFNTTATVSKTSDSAYSTKEAESTFSGTMGYYSASANYKYTYSSTLNITVPATQNGKWEPYMYASTSESVSSNGVGAKELTTLTGAIAIRAFEPDGVTPKQLKSITIISSDAAIAGAFSGSAESSVTANITGAYTSDSYSTVSDNDINIGLVNWPGANKGRAAADELLQSAAQAYEPTSTSVTKAMSLAFTGTEKSVSADNLENIAMDSYGYYTYHLNVAPFSGADLTIVATAVDGSSIVKPISGVSLAAGHRIGGLITWESATLSCGSIQTWYDDYSTDSSFNLAGSTIYANNLKVEGVAADHVLSLGLVVNDTLYGAQSNVSEIEQIVVDGLASGSYNAYAYAKVMVNGEEKELTAAIDSYTVTTIPTVSATVRTSYSSNGTVAKSNRIDGKELQLTATLSDASFPSDFISSVEAVYGSNTTNLTLGSTTKITAAVGAYDCCVKVTLANGYVATSTSYTTYVTGIPYSIDPTTANPSGWKANNTGVQDSRLLLKKNSAYIVSDNLFYSPANCNVEVTVKAAAYHGWGSSTNYLYINPTTSSAVTSGDAISVKGDQYYPDQAKWVEYNKVCTLTDSANEISIYGTVKSSGIQGFTASIMIEDIWINYEL